MAATLEWVDAYGLELGILDHDGAETRRFPFRPPLSSIDDLGLRLHQVLRAGWQAR